MFFFLKIIVAFQIKARKNDYKKREKRKILKLITHQFLILKKIISLWLYLRKLVLLCF